MKKNNPQFFLLSFLVLTAVSTSLAWHFSAKTPEVKAQTTSENWEQLAHDSQNTGHAQIGIAPSYKLKWAWFDKNHIIRDYVGGRNLSITDQLPANFRSSVIFADSVQPIVADGKAYFGSMNGTLYAVDALTGANKWEFPTSGPILATVAYSNGVVALPSMDGNLYGIDANTGTKRWQFSAKAGFMAAPKIVNDVVYIGSRDGFFYAIDLNNGQKKWSFAANYYPQITNHKFNEAPIVATAALSTDGSKVFFGAENMFFYALHTATGQPVWTPKQLNGQSFAYTWPVIVKNKILVYTVSSFLGTENNSTPYEALFDSLPQNVSWVEEKQALLNILSFHPEQKVLYVLDENTGQEPYQVAMGRVTGNNNPPYAFVIDQLGRPISYWRVRYDVFFSGKSAFGTNYAPDISAMDINTGDRINLPLNVGAPTEIDNGFALTTAGDYMYFQNSFRGIHVVNLTTGNHTWVVHSDAISDCANWRDWGAKIIYIGNDSTTNQCAIPDHIPSDYYRADGISGISVATTNGVTMVYSTEPMNFIGAFGQ